jgi:Flp pilus assembly protein TadB
MLLSSALLFAAVFLAAMWTGPAWDSYTKRYISDLRPRLIALGLDDDGVVKALRWWGIALFGTLVVFGVLAGMPPVALGLAYVVFVVPRFILDHLIARRRMTLRDQMVRASGALANTARAGLSLQQGLEKVSQEAPHPLKAELKRIVHDYHAGRPLADSLRETERRLNIESFTMFSSAILVCLERGGRVSFALDRISTTLQEMQRLERKLEADTAAGRKLALILACFPFVFLVLFAVLDPVSTGYLFATLLGQFVLLAVGALVYVSVRWCMRILNVDF